MIYILVCGGRDFTDKKFVFEKLDKLKEAIQSDITIVHGAARGADLLAEEWAKSREVNYRGFPFKYQKYGNAGGPIRNKEMLDSNNIDMVIAFPGGKGTKGMIKLAKAANVKVVEL